MQTLDFSCDLVCQVGGSRHDDQTRGRSPWWIEKRVEMWLVDVHIPRRKCYVLSALALGDGVRGITSDIQRLHKTLVYYRASNWTTGTDLFVIENRDGYAKTYSVWFASCT